jgi:hypothetical protein
VTERKFFEQKEKNKTMNPGTSKRKKTEQVWANTMHFLLSFLN